MHSVIGIGRGVQRRQGSSPIAGACSSTCPKYASPQVPPWPPLGGAAYRPHAIERRKGAFHPDLRAGVHRVRPRLPHAGCRSKFRVCALHPDEPACIDSDLACHTPARRSRQGPWLSPIARCLRLRLCWEQRTYRPKYQSYCHIIISRED
jgi:hypothetical protein